MAVIEVMSEQRLRSACAELARRLRQRERVSAADFLTGLDDDGAVELIYTEWVTLGELGIRPPIDEWLGRYSNWSDRLGRLLQLDAALGTAESIPGQSTAYELDDRVTATTESGYDLVRELGRGGMGVVHLARDRRLGRMVALKTVLGGEYATPADRSRFQAEAEAVARLQHPNIVQVFEAGERDGNPYLALEFVPGGNLADRLRDGPLSPIDAATLVEKLARSLAYAHAQGIVHRDLKPANILLADSATSSDRISTLRTSHSTLDPKIADFGLARQLDRSNDLTRTGAILGTPSYMAPEQASGATVGPPADVYALGAVLYECLTGRPPFRGATHHETLAQVRDREPVAPRTLQPSVPRDLETIGLACLRKEPNRRYPSAEALADDLRRFAEHRPIVARPTGSFERATKWCRRRPAVAGLIAAIVVLAFASFGMIADQWRRATLARDGEQSQREKAEARSASLLLANARLTWMTGDLIGARRTLDECPAEFRDADWAYLDRASAPPLIDVPGDSTGVKFQDESSRPMLMAYSPDGRRIAVVTRGGSLRIWDAATGLRLNEFPLRFEIAVDLAFTPDGRIIVATNASGSASKGIRIGSAEVWTIDQNSGDVLGHWKHPERPQTFVLSPDGQYAAFGGFETGTLLLFDARSGGLRHQFDGHARNLIRAAFSTNGSVLASQGHDQDVRIFDPITGQHLRSIPIGKEAAILMTRGVHPDGSRALLRRSFATNTNRVLLKSATGAPPIEVASEFGTLSATILCPDGSKFAASGSMEKAVVLYDTETGREFLTLRGFQYRVHAMAFSPDGRRLAVSCNDGRIAVWDLTSNH